MSQYQYDGDGGTSFWDYHVSIAALGLLHYGPVNKSWFDLLTGCFLSVYMSQFFFVLFADCVTACSLGSSKRCDAKNCNFQKTQEGAGVRGREEAFKQGVPRNRLQNT